MKYYLFILLLVTIGLPLTAQSPSQSQASPIVDNKILRKAMSISGKLDLSNEESQRLLKVLIDYNQKRKAVTGAKNKQVGIYTKAQLININLQEKLALATTITPTQLFQWVSMNISTQSNRYYTKAGPYLSLSIGVSILAGLGLWTRRRRKLVRV